MGTHVHLVNLGVGLPSVDELGWRFCVCIWYIWKWFSYMHFLIRWSITLAGVCFLRIQCPRVGCHDALSPTEVVQLDVLLSLVLGVWHCNKDLNVSVDLSLELFHLFLWRLTIWQYSMFLTFLGCLLSTLKHLEGFGLKKLKQYLSCLMDFVCVVGSLQLRLETHARSNENSNWAEAIVTSPV